MSPDHTHSHEGDEQSELVQRTAFEVVRLLRSESMAQRETSRVFQELSRALQRASIDLDGPLDAAQFLTRMKLLEGNCCIGLMRAYRPSMNVFKLLVSEDIQTGEFALHFFQDNEHHLQQSRFIPASPEQHQEVVRQLKAIGHAGTALYAVVWLAQPVANYEYFQEGQDTDVDSPVIPPVRCEEDTPGPTQTLVEATAVGSFGQSSNIHSLRPAPGPTLVRFDD